MFANAIETVSAFTRPVNSILRTYGGKVIIPGSSTIFFVNELGVAITCKHVIDLLAAADQINKTYFAFKQERDRIAKDNKFKTALKGLELKYKYTPETVVQIKNTFIDCVDSMSGFTWHLHPKYDLAILKFNDFNAIHYKGYGNFLKESSGIRQGDILCRLGYPFPEFTNFRYDELNDEIEWTTDGIRSSPRFPIDGMVTRFLGEGNKLFGIEMSTPGLKGQSGGPLFNDKGIVYGMQFSTKHLHLGFDIIDKEIMIDNKIKKISNHSFLHLGQCIHLDIIKDFLREMNFTFYEA